MGGKYRMIESVGQRLQDVHSYDQLEKHHPTWKEDPARRNYEVIDGEREEFVRSPSGERLVSKVFILMVGGNASVGVPSPVAGYVRRSDRLDRWGTVQIYDGPETDAKLIAQIRHMDPISVSDGEKVSYGQPLGTQGRKSPPGTKVGLHVHMDFAESRLGEFKQYILDVDAGNIAPGKYPSGRQFAERTGSQAGSNVTRTHGGDNLLEQGNRGEDVRRLQAVLSHLGYRDHAGKELRVDGSFGERTEEGVRAFQRAHGLKVDGVVGADTRGALLHSERFPLLSERPHPNNLLFERAKAGIEKLPIGMSGEEQLDRTAAMLVAQRSLFRFLLGCLPRRLANVIDDLVARVLDRRGREIDVHRHAGHKEHHQ